MTRVSIKPHWTIRFPDDKTLPPRLLGLLAQVNQAGSLSAACQQTGVSYRHAWDLIRQGELLFGGERVEMERGRGSPPHAARPEARLGRTTHRGATGAGAQVARLRARDRDRARAEDVADRVAHPRV